MPENPLKQISRLVDTLEEGVSSAQDALRPLLQERCYIGVSGLSGSGKTTFITSLINQLQHHEQARLGRFSPWINKQIAAVKVHPLERGELPLFPYQDGVQALAGQSPRWPASTVDISGCVIELVLRNTGRWWGSSQRSVYIEIRDYPGEWLLDLPMMSMSFAQWSRQCAHLFNQPPRLHLMGELLDELKALDPALPCNEGQIGSLQKRYVAFLKQCRAGRNSLSLVQPGRFLLPGQHADHPALQFLPLPALERVDDANLPNADDSLYRTLERRYDQYVKEIVTPFYREFFHPIRRQLILVDVLNALNGGPAYLEDMRHTLSNLSNSFSYGKRNPLLALFRPKIEKVVFAATKIDQVASRDHDNVRQLLASMVKDALNEAAYKGAQPSVEAVAAVRASHEVPYEGEPSVQGVGKDGQRVGYVHPDIPDHIPTTDEAWMPFTEWSLPLLNPPAGVRCNQDQALPHIRMDYLIQDLIGDLCQ